MRKRIMLGVVILMAAVLIVMTSVAYFFSFEAYSKAEAVRLTKVLEASTVLGIPEDLDAFSEKLASSLSNIYRITFVDQQGNVLADSSAQTESMENHAQRPEIRAALQSGYGQDVRLSDTTGEKYIYSAKRLDNGAVMRLATPTQSVGEVLRPALLAMLLTGLLAVLASALVSYRYGQAISSAFKNVNRTLDSISSGKYDASLLAGKHTEIAELVGNFDAVSVQIERHVKEAQTGQKKLEYLLENMQEGLVILDSSADILLINRAAKRIFNIPQEENQQDRNILLLIRNITLYNAVKGCIETGEPMTTELTLPAADNAIIRAIVTPVGAAPSEEFDKGAVVLLTDVTQIKKLERMRSDFTANVSHEMKTPLTSIRGFADMLSSGMIENDPEKSRHFLNIIIDETDRLTNLINDVLEISELETLGSDKNPQPVRLDAVAADALAVVQKGAEEKKVTILMDTSEVSVLANYGRMMELFVNLMDNAVKYNKENGRVTVTIGAKDDKALIAVSDTGIGIKEEHLPRLSERFYRVDQGRSRKLGSTGLGLSIVKHILELYKGSFSIESVEGEGTTITARLPLLKQPEVNKGRHK